jgi:hypothetical protein
MNLKFFTKLSLSILLATLYYCTAEALSSNSKHDPYPIFTTLDPHSFLLTQEKFELKDLPTEKDKYDRCSISASPFGQNACGGYSNACLSTTFTNLGDLEGRWGMIGLLFGEVPTGAKLPPSLVTAQEELFPQAEPPLGDENSCAIDGNRLTGFFTIPLEYRKRGIRFEFSGQFSHNFGIKIQTGFADMCQTPTFKNLTPTPATTCCATTDANITTTSVNTYLMCKLHTIAREIGLDISPFHEVSFEDLRAYLYWRKAYLMNEDREGWEKFLFIPFLMFGGSISVEKERDFNKAFSLSFGNNNHHSIAGVAGLNIDFVETIEIGAEFGLTHFFAQDFCNFRVPNSVYQSGIYPFTTNITRKPGLNWHFGAKLSAYRFMGNLSFYAQYINVTHEKDCIQVKKCSAAFKPELLEQRSCWKAHRANFGFNYDISPYISLGMLWQIPLAQQNTYNSSTLLFSINACY